MPAEVGPGASDLSNGTLRAGRRRSPSPSGLCLSLPALYLSSSPSSVFCPSSSIFLLFYYVSLFCPIAHASSPLSLRRFFTESFLSFVVFLVKSNILHFQLHHRSVLIY